MTRFHVVKTNCTKCFIQDILSLSMFPKYEEYFCNIFRCKNIFPKRFYLCWLIKKKTLANHRAHTESTYCTDIEVDSYSAVHDNNYHSSCISNSVVMYHWISDTSYHCSIYKFFLIITRKNNNCPEILYSIVLTFHLFPRPPKFRIDQGLL